MIDYDQVERAVEQRMRRTERLTGLALLLLVAVDIIAFGAAGWITGSWILGKN
jgi:fatty acid desaturase